MWRHIAKKLEKLTKERRKQDEILKEKREMAKKILKKGQITIYIYIYVD